MSQESGSSEAPPPPPVANSVAHETADAQPAWPARLIRVAVVVALTGVMLAVFTSLGGPSSAARGFQSAMSVATGGERVQRDTPARTGGAQCDVAIPCGFAVYVTATNRARSTQGHPPASNAVHIGPAWFDRAVYLSYAVSRHCGGSTSGIRLKFLDDPIPAGQNLTRFAITTHRAAEGTYTVTISGTAGTETESGTFTFVVGRHTGC